MPARTSRSEGFSESEERIVFRVVAKFLSGAKGLGVHDADDLQQFCREHWLKKRSRVKHDGPAEPTTVMYRALWNRLLDLWDEENTLKRGGGRETVSLDRPLVPGEDTSLQDVLPDDREDADVAQLAQGRELASALRSLRDYLRPEECELLDALVHDGMHVASGKLRIPPSTGYQRLKRIRLQAEELGLSKFLPRADGF